MNSGLPLWAQIFLPVLTAVLTLIATTVTTHFLNGPKRKREEREAELKALLDKIDTLSNNTELLKTGLQAIIKNDLKVRYEHWIAKKYAPLDAKEDLERMYAVYHSLGANGVMDGMRKEFMDLPTERNK